MSLKNNGNDDVDMALIEDINETKNDLIVTNMVLPSKERMNSQINESMNNIEIPLNTLREKVEFCLPMNSQIEDDAIIAINQSLNGFLCYFAKKIKYENNKIMIKNIKTTIETEKTFAFLRKLTEK